MVSSEICKGLYTLALTQLTQDECDRKNYRFFKNLNFSQYNIVFKFVSFILLIYVCVCIYYYNILHKIFTFFITFDNWKFWFAFFDVWGDILDNYEFSEVPSNSQVFDCTRLSKTVSFVFH